MNISQAGNCILKQFNKAQARLGSEAGEAASDYKLFLQISPFTA